MIDLHGLPQVVTAIGGLGTAAFGLVDASKAMWGGVNHIGFGGIKKTVTEFDPGQDDQWFIAGEGAGDTASELVQRD
jgi:hypothetical protein